MKRSKVVSVLFAVIGLTTALAACGDDDDAASSPTTVATTAPASGGSDTTEPAAATGEPIRLGLILRPLYEGFLPAGAEAAIARVNAEGGVNGRPLELVTCSNEDNAAAAAACANDFVSDSSIIATVGDNNSFGADSNPPLEQAQIAGVGTSPLGGGDFGSPRIFPTNSGGLQFLATAAFLHDTLGIENIGMATADTPTAQALPGLLNDNVLASRGAELGASVAIPLTAADVSSQAASLSDSDGILLALSQDLALRFIQSSRQQGFTGPFMISETVVEASAIQEALSPAETEDIYAVTYFDKTSDGYANFLADMAEFEPDVTPGDLNAISWLSVMMFADVASELPEVTREAVFEAMNQLSDYDTDGMTVPLDFTEEGTVLGGTAPRLVPSVLQVYADTYRDGEYVPFDEEEQTPIPVFS